MDVLALESVPCPSGMRDITIIAIGTDDVRRRGGEEMLGMRGIAGDRCAQTAYPAVIVAVVAFVIVVVVFVVRDIRCVIFLADHFSFTFFSYDS